MNDVTVRCEGDRTGAWMCEVTVREGSRDVSTHRVAVAPQDLERLAPGAADPTDLVERSFVFLLEREPPSSILRSFDLPVIGRYFPEYETTIRRRTGATS
jgi:hypothetical protein